MHGYSVMDDGERRKIMDPDVILPMIGLKSGMTFVDVGCGSGFFAIPAARIVGEEGTVHGIDIDGRALEFLRWKASNAGLKVITLQGEAESTLVCRGCADIVFFGICLHDFEDPREVLKNARRMLRPGGAVVDLDYKKVETESGPPMWKRLSEEDATRLIEGADFKIASVEDLSRVLYLIVARKDR